MFYQYSTTFTFLPYQKHDMVKHELQVTSYELKFKSTSWNSNPQVTSSNPRVASSKTRVQESLNYWIIKALIKSSSFSTTISPELFGKLWGHLCVQFPMILSCFKFQLLWKKRSKFHTEK